MPGATYAVRCARATPGFRWPVRDPPWIRPPGSAAALRHTPGLETPVNEQESAPSCVHRGWKGGAVCRARGNLPAPFRLGQARVIRTPVALLLCLSAGLSQAAVYRWVAPDGSTVFSDSRPAGGRGPAVQEVHIRPPRTVPALIPLRTERRSPPAAVPQTPGRYTDFAIRHPNDQGVLRANSGTVSVEITLRPALQRGHRIVLSMDGKVIAQGPQTAFRLLNVDRGTHTLEATVEDESGRPAGSTPPISFSLQRHSVLHRNAGGRPAPAPRQGPRRAHGPRGLSGPPR